MVGNWFALSYTGGNCGKEAQVDGLMQPIQYKNEARPVCIHFWGVMHVDRCIFYRAMLCIHGTSHGPASVCVCVCLSQVRVLLKRLNV